MNAQGLDSLFSLDTFTTVSSRAAFLNEMGYRLRKTDPVAAKQLVDSGFALSSSVKDSATLGNSYNLYGILNRQLGNYDEAIENYNEALQLFVALEREALVSSMMNNIGVIYEEQEKFDEALNFYQQSLAVDLSMQDSAMASIRFWNIASIHQKQGDYDSARIKYEISLQIEESINNIEGIYYAALGLGSLAREEHDFTNADTYLKRALELARTMKSDGYIAASYKELGNLRSEEGLFESAIEHYSNALSIFRRLQQLKELQEIHQKLSEAHAQMGSFQASRLHMQRYVEISDSLRSNELDEKLSRYNAQFSVQLKERENALLLKQREVDAKNIERANLMLWGAGLMTLLLSILAVVIYRGYRTNKLKNLKLGVQARQIQKQNQDLTKFNTHITDSIEYAKRIQEAILPLPQDLHDAFDDHFVLYLPKDIVSGDFYWMFREGDTTYFAVADCTGHGVPGAFMSIVGHSLLEKVVKQGQLREVDHILAALGNELYTALRKGTNTDVKDGMDIGLLKVNRTQRTLSYAGAHHPLYLLRKQEVEVIKGDRIFLGKHDTLTPDQFNVTHLELNVEDQVFLFSDGFADQKGGPAGKKFMYPPFRKLLCELAMLPTADQKAHLQRAFEHWKGKLEQIDDVIIFGLRFDTMEKSKESSSSKSLEKHAMEETLYSYSGEVTPETVNAVISSFRSIIRDHDALNLLVRKKAYKIWVEAVENVLKHGAASEGAVKCGEFKALLVNQQLILTACNRVADEDVSALRERLERAQQLNRQELKEAYKAQLMGGGISERGGAGLGILDMAIKSKSPIQFNLEASSAQAHLLELEITIELANN